MRFTQCITVNKINILDYSALKEVMQMKHNTTEMDCSIYSNQ